MSHISLYHGCFRKHLKAVGPCFLNPRQKNQEGKIIIMYDNDETIAHRAVTTLVERGYENLFMLSGGRSLIIDIQFVVHVSVHE